MTFEKKSKSEIYYIRVNANCFFCLFSFATYVGDYLLQVLLFQIIIQMYSFEDKSCELFPILVVVYELI